MGGIIPWSSIQVHPFMNKWVLRTRGQQKFSSLFQYCYTFEITGMYSLNSRTYFKNIIGIWILRFTDKFYVVIYNIGYLFNLNIYHFIKKQVCKQSNCTWQMLLSYIKNLYQYLYLQIS